MRFVGGLVGEEGRKGEKGKGMWFGERVFLSRRPRFYLIVGEWGIGKQAIM